MKIDPETEGKLRNLADAIAEREDANTFPGISHPADLRWLSHNGGTLEGYGDNPTLLLAIKHEIWKQWPDLRAAALRNMDDRIQRLSSDLVGTISDLSRKEAQDSTRSVAERPVA